MGIAFISISETVGIKMIIRLINHILQYCELPLKRMVPIMLTVIGAVNFNV